MIVAQSTPAQAVSAADIPIIPSGATEHQPPVAADDSAARRAVRHARIRPTSKLRWPTTTEIVRPSPRSSSAAAPAMVVNRRAVHHAGTRPKSKLRRPTKIVKPSSRSSSAAAPAMTVNLSNAAHTTAGKPSSSLGTLRERNAEQDHIERHRHKTSTSTTNRLSAKRHRHLRGPKSILKNGKW